MNVPHINSGMIETQLEPLLTSLEAGGYFGKSANGMAVWRHVGGGPRFVRLNRTIRYRPSDIAAYVAENVQEGGTSVA